MEGIELAEYVYYSSLGVTGLAAMLKTEKPSIFMRFWIDIFVFFLLPTLFCGNLYGGLLETSISKKFTGLGLGLEQFQIFLFSIYFYFTHKRMRRIVLDLRSFNSVRHCGSKAEEMIGSRAKIIKKVQNIYFLITFFCFLTWSSAPVVLNSESLFFGNHEKIVKVAPAMYPFRVDYTPMVQIIFVAEVIMTWGILSHFISMNLFFFTSLVMVCQVFEILNVSLLKEGGRNPIKIKELVIDHQRLLSICQEIKDLLSPLLAVQLLLSIITNCFAIFELTIVNGDDDGSQVVEFVKKCINSFFLLSQLLFFCWISSELESSCDSLRDGLYASPWYENLPRLGYKDYIIINCRASRPFQLTAMYLINLKLGTFLEVMRVSYSYYTMLKRMHS